MQPITSYKGLITKTRTKFLARSVVTGQGVIVLNRVDLDWV